MSKHDMKSDNEGIRHCHKWRTDTARASMAEPYSLTTKTQLDSDRIILRSIDVS